MYTVEPPKTDTPKSGQPLYNGQTSWNGLNEFTIHGQKPCPQCICYSETSPYILYIYKFRLKRTLFLSPSKPF